MNFLENLLRILGKPFIAAINWMEGYSRARNENYKAGEDIEYFGDEFLIEESPIRMSLSDGIETLHPTFSDAYFDEPPDSVA